MFGNSINIFDVKPNKITSNLLQYPIILSAESGVGKTSTLFNVLTKLSPEGKVPLFLSFESRFSHLKGIHAIRIHSVAELEAVKNQLLTPQAKERFSCIVLDTIDSCETMLSNYVAKSKNVAILDEIGYGRGGKYLKSASNFINELKDGGWTLHYCLQLEKATNFTTNKVEYVPKVAKQILNQAFQDCYLCGAIEIDPISGERIITFKKSPTYPMLKDSLNLPAKIKANELDVALREAIENLAGGELTDENTIAYEVKKTDFTEIKSNVQSLGAKLYEQGLGKETSSIMNKVLGVDEQGNPISFESIIETQVEVLELLYTKLKELADKKGIK